MARDDDRNRILAIRQADGANGRGLADCLCLLAVAASLAVRNFCESLPCPELKWGATHIKGYLKVAELSGKVSVELGNDGGEMDRILDGLGGYLKVMTLAIQIEPTKSFFRGDQTNRADHRGNDAMTRLHGVSLVFFKLKGKEEP